MLKLGLVPTGLSQNTTLENAVLLQNILKRAADSGYDFLCFGEAFLQGYSVLTQDYSLDLPDCLSGGGEILSALQKSASIYHTGLAFGYLERSAERLYSSYAFFTKEGKNYHNYRRMDPGWHSTAADRDFYREGVKLSTFRYAGKKIAAAFPEDLYSVFNHTFLTDSLQGIDLLLCPDSPEKYDGKAQPIDMDKLAEISRRLDCILLVVNCLDSSDCSALYIKNGEILSGARSGQTEIFTVEV